MTGRPSSQELADRLSVMPEIVRAREMTDLLRRAGTGWLMFAKEMPDIFDDALDALAARLQAAEQALRAYDRGYFPHRYECQPLSERGCTCGLEEARKLARRALEGAAE